MKTGEIRSILEGCARKMCTITYGELGELIGRLARGRWPELDVICKEDSAADRPDLSLLVVYKGIDLPGKFRGKKDLKSKDWTPIMKEQYRQDRDDVYDHYRP